MNKRLTKGFTLFELLVTIFIVTVIVIFSLGSIKNTLDVTKFRYAQVYKMLEHAHYNTIISENNPFSSTNKSKSNAERIKLLCLGISSYMNDVSTSCSSSTVGFNVYDFSNLNYSLKLANNMKIYFSNIVDVNDDYNTAFVLAFVDINGDKKPNTTAIKYNENNITDSNNQSYTKDATIEDYPDVYVFALTNMGLVVPMGLAEYDINVMGARLAHYTITGDTVISRKTEPLYIVKQKAWGYTQAGNAYKTEPSREEPLALQDYIRQKLPSGIWKTMNLPTNVKSAELAKDYNCIKDDFESCYIVIDEYK